MQELYRPQAYPPDLRRKVRLLAPVAIMIANRWMLGWPKRVQALMASGEYLPALIAQWELEQAAYDKADESGQYRHLARHEIAQVMGMVPHPPMPEAGDVLEDE